MAVRSRVLLLCLLGGLAPGSPARAQASARGWTVRFTSSAVAFSLDYPSQPRWRLALAPRVGVTLGDHARLGMGVLTSYASRPAGAVCPAGFGGCASEPERPAFSIVDMTAGLRTSVGRFNPFVDVGGGRVKVQGKGAWTSLIGAGMDVALTPALGLTLGYRMSRATWRRDGVRVDREVGLGVSVLLLDRRR